MRHQENPSALGSGRNVRANGMSPVGQVSAVSASPRTSSLSVELFEQRRVRGAFVAMAKHLRARPEPRACFDEAAGNRSTPGWPLVRAARTCLDAAKEKDAATLDRTREEVEAFCDILKDAMLRGFERTECTAESAIVALAREESETLSAMTRYGVTRAPQDAEEVRKDVRLAVEAGERVLRLGRRFALPVR
jgi:hypothetical protein